MRRLAKLELLQQTFLFGLATFIALASCADRASAWQEESTDSNQSATQQSTTAPSEEATQIEGLGEVRPASFKDITPGLSTLEDVTAKLGEPSGRFEDGEATTLTFDIQPFAGVDVTVADSVVTSIMLRFSEPTEVAAIAKGLKIDGIRPAPIPDENGELLGQVYPQRGILFGFTEVENEYRISYILLEPISAEPFILRAQHDSEFRYSENLIDLDYAQQLDPSDARIYGQRAAILLELDRISGGLKDAEKAIRIDPANVPYRLTYARLLGFSGEHEEAVKIISEMIAAETIPVELKASGESILGDLLADKSKRRYKDAIKHHLAAIELAAPKATDTDDVVRRRAKRTLVDIHLAIAGDIAGGRWQHKSEVVPKWLSKANILVDDLIENEGGDASLRLLVRRKAIEVLTSLKGEIDPSTVVAAIINESRQLIATASDPLRKQQLEWDLGKSFLNAARVERTRGQHDLSLKYANNALALLKQAQTNRETPLGHSNLLGSVHFFIGTHYATAGNDHAEAVSFYEKAMPYYAQPLPDWAVAEIGRRGEEFVSMGVSYWQIRNYEQGMQLTQKGVQYIQQSVNAEAMYPATLAIPYGNLASMLKETGNEEEAARLAQRAAQLKNPQTGSQQR